MKDDSLLWIIGLGVVGYFAYQNGWLSILGLCPSGFHAASDMFPTCASNALTASVPPSGTPAPSSSTLPPGTQWTWYNGQWVQTTTMPTASPAVGSTWLWNGSQWAQVQMQL
jgi:hypothetical protein